MATVPTAAVVRDILKANINLAADEVIKKAKARGVTASDASIRQTVHTTRSDMKKAGAAAPAAKPTPVVAAARSTAPARPAAPVTSTPAPAATDLSTVLANVALVNKVVGASGGVDNARQVAEVVRMCGGVDAFLAHVETVANIRQGVATA